MDFKSVREGQAEFDLAPEWLATQGSNFVKQAPAWQTSTRVSATRVTSIEIFATKFLR